MMLEPAAKFFCGECQKIIIAPQWAKFLICSYCHNAQDARSDTMMHFSIWGNKYNFAGIDGQDRYLESSEAMVLLQQELANLQRLQSMVAGVDRPGQIKANLLGQALSASNKATVASTIEAQLAAVNIMIERYHKRDSSSKG